MLIQLAFITLAHSKGLASNPPGDLQDMLLDKFIEILIDQVVKVSPLHHTELHNTTLKKTTHHSITAQTRLRPLHADLHNTTLGKASHLGFSLPRRFRFLPAHSTYPRFTSGKFALPWPSHWAQSSTKVSEEVLVQLGRHMQVAATGGSGGEESGDIGVRLKAGLVSQMRDGAVRPIKAADSLQKIQTENPQAIAAFVVVCVLGLIVATVFKI